MKHENGSRFLKHLLVLIALVSINFICLSQSCTPQGDQVTYGSNNVWIGYMYQETNLTNYKGFTNRGGLSGTFDETLAGANGTIATNGCYISTKQFSARFLLKKPFSAGTYTIIVGAAGGYRFSLDGGTTWAINNWVDQAYNTTNHSVYLKGTYNLVLEYFVTGANNRSSFSVSTGLLPLSIKKWSANIQSPGKVRLSWVTDAVIDFDHFIIQRSINATQFINIATVENKNDNNNISYPYEYIDKEVPEGVSYYRLVMVDKDGTLRNSDIQSISTKSDGALTVFPTIVENRQLRIRSNKPIMNGRIELVSLFGQVVQTINWTNDSFSQNIIINNTVTPGNYLLKVSDAKGMIELKKIIIH